MSFSADDLPALLGGQPIRPNGPPSWPRIDVQVEQVLKGLVESGDWGRYHGPHVPALCRSLAELHNVEHVLLSSSGTSAMELALRGVGVQEGDEVILAAYDFKSNFQNVLHLKATPVLVDLDPETWQLDAKCLENAITSKTRAILTSHLHGGVVAMPQVRQIADSRGIAIVEDACQNPGAILYGRTAGTWGDVGVISFGGSKVITAGRGGAILTARAEIAERIKRYSWRGNDAYPLSEIQAAILLPQVQQLPVLNSERLQAVVRLCNLLEAEGFEPLQLPTTEIYAGYYKVGFQYSKGGFSGLHRELFLEAMRAEGIAFDAGFRSNHLIHASRRFRAVGDLVEATRADTDMITLYHPVLLEGSSALDEIVTAVRRIRRYSGAIAERHADINQAVP